MKAKVMLYLDKANWKEFKIKCLQKDVIPSHAVDKFIESFCQLGNTELGVK